MKMENNLSGNPTSTFGESQKNQILKTSYGLNHLVTNVCRIIDELYANINVNKNNIEISENNLFGH